MKDEVAQIKEQMELLELKTQLEQAKINYDNIRDNNIRARSISIGTAFGGIVEINMRANDGSVSYVLLQPPEAVELIKQLSSSVGLEYALRPSTDFSAWRGWEEVIGEKVPTASIEWKGASPQQLPRVATLSRIERIQQLKELITERKLNNIAAGRPIDWQFEEVEREFGEDLNLYPEVAELVAEFTKGETPKLDEPKESPTEE